MGETEATYDIIENKTLSLAKKSIFANAIKLRIMMSSTEDKKTQKFMIVYPYAKFELSNNSTLGVR